MSAAALPGKLSREDFKKQKELEELRKTGAAPPELDDDGNMISQSHRHTRHKQLIVGWVHCNSLRKQPDSIVIRMLPM